MRILCFDVWLWCAALTLACAGAARADQSGPAAPSVPAPVLTGVAYDEIRWHAVDIKPFAPGSFASDRETLIKRVSPTDRYPDVHGNIQGNLGANLMSTTPEFIALYRYSYLGDWIRVDDLIAQTATISRPDLGETIYLNLKTKTYHSDKTPPPTAPMPAPSASASPSPNPSPSASPSYNYLLEINSEQAPGMSIDGLQTTGTTGEGNFSTLQATASCIQVQGSLTWVLYQATDFHTAPRDPFTNFANVTTPRMFSRCAVQSKSSLGGVPAPNLMLYFSLVMTLATGPIRIGPIDAVTERGNVVKLGANDTGLFAIPPDFTPQSKVTMANATRVAARNPSLTGIRYDDAHVEPTLARNAR